MSCRPSLRLLASVPRPPGPGRTTPSRKHSEAAHHPRQPADGDPNQQHASESPSWVTTTGLKGRAIPGKPDSVFRCPASGLINTAFRPRMRLEALSPRASGGRARTLTDGSSKRLQPRRTESPVGGRDASTARVPALLFVGPSSPSRKAEAPPESRTFDSQCPLPGAGRIKSSPSLVVFATGVKPHVRLGQPSALMRAALRSTTTLRAIFGPDRCWIAASERRSVISTSRAGEPCWYRSAAAAERCRPRRITSARHAGDHGRQLSVAQRPCGQPPTGCVCRVPEAVGHRDG